MDAELLAFLLGEAPLDGVWFGDKHPTERGQFWWRKRLRALSPPASAPAFGDPTGLDAATKEADRLGIKSTDALRILAVYEVAATAKPASAAVVPEGWVLVPKVCTADMEDAGLLWVKGFRYMRKQDRRNAMAQVYDAMLAATPSPPVGEKGEGA